ncbi:MAG: hypothetical protein L0Y55_00670 [Anaerolineales bacterium]|nr:hypothetical protein [Anaerolineales bacterium]
MFKKSLFVLFIAVAVFTVAGLDLSTASAAGWCAQSSGDCAQIPASFDSAVRPTYVYPNDPGLATKITPTFKVDPLFTHGSVDAREQLPE